MALYEEFTIDQGADFALELVLEQVSGATKNLTGYSAAAMMKRSYNSDSSGTVQMGAIVASPASAGIVSISLTNQQTDQLKAGRYFYDVEISFVDSASNIIIERVLEGQITVSPSVTRTPT
jgi:hypothetical protein